MSRGTPKTQDHGRRWVTVNTKPKVACEGTEARADRFEEQSQARGAFMALSGYLGVALRLGRLNLHGYYGNPWIH